MIAKLIARPPGKKDRDPAGARSTFHRDLTLYILRADPEALARLNESGESGIHNHDSYVRNLNNYAAGARHEEVGVTLTRNLVSTEPDAIALELEARLAGAGLSNNYVHHMVLSWRPDEHYEQHIEEASALFLNAMGFANCPAVIGEHRDTDNPHIHLMVAPVDAVTGEKVPRYEFDKVRSQMATAVLCDRFGWRAEENARYSVVRDMLVRDDQDVLGRVDTPARWPDRPPPPLPEISKRARTFEEEHGRLSLERLVQERVPRLLEECTDLAELDRRLAVLGITLARFGNGAAFFDKDTRVAASKADRWSCRKIEAKFGPLPRHNAASQAKLDQTPVFTSLDMRRTKYEEVKRQYHLRLSTTIEGFRDAGFADPNLARRLCSASANVCTFPSFEDWQGGLRPYDPVEIFGAFFNIPTVSQAEIHDWRSGFRTVSNRDIKALRLDADTAARLVITGRPLCIDLGDSFLMAGKLSERDIYHVMGTLASRGQRSLVTTGFTPEEQTIADRYAKANGLTVVHDRTAAEAEAIRRAPKEERAASNNARPVREPVHRPTPPVRHSPTQRTQDPKPVPQTSAPAPAPIQSVSPPGSPSSPAITGTASEKIDKPDTTEKAQKKVSDWQKAFAEGSQDANRLAYVVRNNAEALRHAEAVLQRKEFVDLKTGAAAHLAQMNRGAGPHQGMSR